MNTEKSNKSKEVLVKEFVFANPIGSHFWDSMTSKESVPKGSETLNFVLDFIKDDY